MICFKCGKEITDNIEVCRYCGARANVKGNNQGSESLSHLMDNIDSIDVDENGDFVTVPLHGEIDVLATEPLPENERGNAAVQYNQPVAMPSFEKNNTASNSAPGKSNTPLIVGIIVGVIGVIVAIIAIAALLIYMPGNISGNNGEDPQNQGEDYIIGEDDENYVEEQTDSNGETVPVTETTKKENDTTKESTETTTERSTTEQAVTSNGPMTKADFISFFNTETAKASKGSYRVVRTGYLTQSVDAGKASGVLKMLAPIFGTDIDSAFGDLLGIEGDVSTNVTGGRTSNCDSKYLLKATKLTSSDISNYSVNGDEYTLVLKNCTNPGSSSALAHATNDYVTIGQLNQEFLAVLGSHFDDFQVEEETKLNYSNIIFKVTVRDGVIKGFEYSYTLDAKPKMTMGGIIITSTCAGKVYGKYSYFNY